MPKLLPPPATSSFESAGMIDNQLRALGTDLWVRGEKGHTGQLRVKFGDLPIELQELVEAVTLLTNGEWWRISEYETSNDGDGGNELLEVVGPKDATEDEIVFHPTIKDYARARHLLSEMAQASLEVSIPIYRGMALSHVPRPGETIDLGLVASWSANPDVAEDFASDEDWQKDRKKGDIPVVLVLPEPKRGTDIAPVSAWANESEVVTGGKVRVTHLENDKQRGGTRWVYVEQLPLGRQAQSQDDEASELRAEVEAVLADWRARYLAAGGDLEWGASIPDENGARHVLQTSWPQVERGMRYVQKREGLSDAEFLRAWLENARTEVEPLLQRFEQGAQQRHEENTQAAREEALDTQGVEVDNLEDLPEDGQVWAWHGTSNVFRDAILQQGISPQSETGIASNYANVTEGVFLSLRPDVSFYARAAVAKHGGEPMTVQVLVDVADLQPDPDDEDIGPGQWQVITDYVAPGQIAKIDDEWVPDFVTQHARRRQATVEQDALPGGLSDEAHDRDFDPDALAAGIEVELEHTTDPALAKEIAQDHLTEDPEYYTKLREMEHGARRAAKVEDTVVIHGVSARNLRHAGQVDDAGDPDLSYLLGGPGETAQIGEERGRRPRDPETYETAATDIARYVSPHGSYRYVYYLDDVPVSALQVVKQPGEKRWVGTIANVWTDPAYRRQRLARQLLERARQDFDEVRHSKDLSNAGMAWRDKVGASRTAAMGWTGTELPHGIDWTYRNDRHHPEAQIRYAPGEHWKLWLITQFGTQRVEVASGTDLETEIAQVQAILSQAGLPMPPLGTHKTTQQRAEESERFKKLVEKQRKEQQEISPRVFPALLKPPGECYKKVGNERVETDGGPDGVSHYIGEGDFGYHEGYWHRFVQFMDGTPVSGLLLRATRPRKGQQSATIEEVYTAPEHRRQGHAAQLLEAARAHFRKVQHSKDLTDAGRAWKRRVGKIESLRQSEQKNRNAASWPPPDYYVVPEDRLFAGLDLRELDVDELVMPAIRALRTEEDFTELVPHLPKNVQQRLWDILDVEESLSQNRQPVEETRDPNNPWDWIDASSVSASYGDRPVRMRADIPPFVRQYMAAVRKWTGEPGGVKRMRQALKPGEAKITSADRRAAETLRQLALTEDLPPDVPLFRGVHMQLESAEELDTGYEIDLGTLSSWSEDPMIARNFSEHETVREKDIRREEGKEAGRQTVLLQLTRPERGHYIGELSQYPHEKEVVLSGKVRVSAPMQWDSKLREWVLPVEQVFDSRRSASRLTDVAAKYPTWAEAGAVDIVAELDPSGSTHKYLNWMMRQLEDIFTVERNPEVAKALSGHLPRLATSQGRKLAEQIKKFVSLSRMLRPDKRDLNAYDHNALDRLFSIHSNTLREIEEKQRKKREELEGTEIVAEDADSVLYRITSTAASCKYGRGTKWCISAKEENKFSHLMESGYQVFMWIPKAGNDATKVAVAYHPETGVVESYADDDVPLDAAEVPTLVKQTIRGQHGKFLYPPAGWFNSGRPTGIMDAETFRNIIIEGEQAVPQSFTAARKFYVEMDASGQVIGPVSVGDRPSDKAVLTVAIVVPGDRVDEIPQQDIQNGVPEAWAKLGELRNPALDRVLWRREEPIREARRNRRSSTKTSQRAGLRSRLPARETLWRALLRESGVAYPADFVAADTAYRVWSNQYARNRGPKPVYEGGETDAINQWLGLEGERRVSGPYEGFLLLMRGARTWSDLMESDALRVLREVPGFEELRVPEELYDAQMEREEEAWLAEQEEAERAESRAHDQDAQPYDESELSPEEEEALGSDAFDFPPLVDRKASHAYVGDDFVVRGDGIKFWVTHKDFDGYKIEVPASSVAAIRTDLKGWTPQISATSSNDAVNSVIRGEGTFIGRGNDSLVWEIGDQVVKLMSTVPYQPMNMGYRTLEETRKQGLAQAKSANEANNKAGTQLFPNTEVVTHEGRTFLVQPKLNVPKVWDQSELTKLQKALVQLHDAGFALHDEVQAGLTPEGQIQFFDFGGVGPVGRYSKEDDLSSLQRLHDKHNVPYRHTDEEFDKEWKMLSDYVKWFVRKRDRPVEQSLKTDKNEGLISRAMQENRPDADEVHELFYFGPAAENATKEPNE